MNNNYKKPLFEIVRQDESNKVFFAASTPAPTPTQVGATLSNVGGWL